jgi:hypothetical protein
MMIMKILIQEATKGLFLGVSGAWVGRNEKLMQFSGTVAALRFCLSNNFKNVRLLLAFRKRALNFFVSPFDEEQSPEFAGRPDFRISVLQMARNLGIQQENLALREELGRILEERKLRRRKAHLGRHQFIQARKLRAA